jgi:uncharacterized membrane protein YhhN
MTYAAWSLFAVVALADWAAVRLGSRRAESLLKPAALVALIGVALALGAGDSTYGVWLVVALGFGLLGDIALLSDSVPRFKAGLAAFLVGHLAYVVAFIAAPGAAFTPATGLVAGLVLAASISFTKDVLPTIMRTEGTGLAVPVAAYMAVIGAMLFAGFTSGIALVALGAAIFVASDSILARDRFVAPLPHGHLMVMVTYHLGQALIVAGLLA